MPWQEQTRQLLLKHEGIRLSSYKDSLGIPTIGVGFNLTRPDARKRLTQVGVTLFTPLRLTTEQALALLDLDIADAVADIQSMFPTFNGLSDNQKSVLIDMRVQLGPNRFRGFQHFIDAVNAGQFATAGAEMLSSNWAKQVPGRAKEDVELIQS